MSHPRDLSRILDSLDPDGVATLAHLLSCPDCAAQVRQALGDGFAADSLSAHDLATLERLQETLLRRQEEFGRFAARLRRKKGSPAHSLVVSRLECLMADRLAPALAELASIAETARGNFEPGDE
jgi:hypothetical protein